MSVCLSVCICICVYVPKLWSALDTSKIVGFGWNLAHLFLGWISGGVFFIFQKFGFLGPGDEFFTTATIGPQNSWKDTEVEPSALRTFDYLNISYLKCTRITQTPSKYFKTLNKNTKISRYLIQQQESEALSVINMYVREKLHSLRQQQEDMAVLISQVSNVCSQCDRALKRSDAEVWEFFQSLLW